MADGVVTISVAPSYLLSGIDWRMSNAKRSPFDRRNFCAEENFDSGVAEVMALRSPVLVTGNVNIGGRAARISGVAAG